MPHKEWQDGVDPLSAFNINTYIQSQVVVRFANTVERATWTSPPTGAVCYVTGVGYQVYNGSAWVTVIPTNGGFPSTGWIAPTLLNTWTNFAFAPHNVPAGYRRLPTGEIALRGLLDAGASSSTQAMFNLPVGFRPQYSEIFAAWASGGWIRLDVEADGDVRPVTATAAGADVSLAGIRFFPA